MVNISIVQGRLSKQVGSRYQYFPINSWENEFHLAREIGFNSIEWIISDLSNPILDENKLSLIEELSDRSKVKVASISLDILMYEPIFHQSWDDLLWFFKHIVIATSRLGIKRISIPVEENSGLSNVSQVEKSVINLKKVINFLEDKIPRIAIETDLSPLNIFTILQKKGLGNLGIVLDLGNAAANGYNIETYIKLLKNNIYAYHIKDRKNLFGLSCPLGQGDAEIQLALSYVNSLPNLSDITIQAYRTKNNYLENATDALEFVKKFL